MPTLVLTDTVLEEIVATVRGTRAGLETGVKLFGTLIQLPQSSSRDSRRSGQQMDSASVVLAVAGPGKHATHQSAHYSGDDEYENEIFAALHCAMPGIQWLGELHVHPQGMTWLSGGDRRTVKEILTGTDDTLHPQHFVAGVMQRRDGAVGIYPYQFTRECLEGELMPLLVMKDQAPLVQRARLRACEKGRENDRPNICAQSSGSRAAEKEALGHHWLRQWRQRLGAYGRALRRGQAHAR